MRKIIVMLAGILAVSAAAAQKLENTQLLVANKNRQASVMQAFADRKSTREFSNKNLSLRDLSDLIWAANGINRQESGKRTAPSARNRQDIYIYVCRAEGNYLYNYKKHMLEPVSDRDVRPVKEAPVCLILVADTDDEMTGVDAGIVSQNISIFCSAFNLATVCRANMDKEELSKALKLPEGHRPMLNHPVGYFK